MKKGTNLQNVIRNMSWREIEKKSDHSSISQENIWIDKLCGLLQSYFSFFILYVPHEFPESSVNINDQDPRAANFQVFKMTILMTTIVNIWLVLNGFSECFVLRLYVTLCGFEMFCSFNFKTLILLYNCETNRHVKKQTRSVSTEDTKANILGIV